MIAPVREWRMGREEEIAYAREHGIPVKGGTEAPPYSIDDNLWGRSSEGGAIEDLAPPPRDDVFQLVTRPEEAPDEPQLVRVGFERGRPVSIDGERLGLVELLERAAASGAATASGSSTTSRTGSSASRFATSTRCPPRRSSSPRTATSRSSSRRSTRTTSSTCSTPVGLPLLCRAVVEPLREDLDAYMESANRYVTGEVTMKLYKGSATPVARSSPYALYDRALAGFGESGGEFSQARAPASSSCSRCRAGWRIGSAAAGNSES